MLKTAKGGEKMKTPDEIIELIEIFYETAKEIWKHSEFDGDCSESEWLRPLKALLALIKSDSFTDIQKFKKGMERTYSLPVRSASWELRGYLKSVYNEAGIKPPDNCIYGGNG